MASLDTIAQRLGVSRRTVANVLSGSSQPVRTAAVKRARRIRKLADELGYRPNAAAKAISTGRFRSVALLIPIGETTGTVPIDMQTGIIKALSEHDEHLIVTRLPDRDLTDVNLMPRILREHCVDGLLINYTHDIPPLMVELVEQHRIPAIWLNSERDHDCVRHDDELAGRMATEHALEQGRRRVIYVDLSHNDQILGRAHYSARHRAAGYRQAIEAAGQEPIVVRGATVLPVDQRLAFIREAIERHRPDAIVTYSSPHATVAMAAATEKGMRAPDDLLLVSIGRPSDLFGLPIAVVTLDQGALGIQAAQLLLKKIDQPDRKWPAVAVAPGRAINNLTELTQPSTRSTKASTDSQLT